MKPSILIGSSLALGALGGVVVHWNDYTADTTAPAAASGDIRADGTPNDTLVAPGAQPAIAPEEETPLLSRSEDETFGAQSPERQKEVLLKLSSRLLRGASSGDQLQMARAMSQLSYEQASGLWESITKTEGLQQDPANVAHAALIEHLAALDPKRTLELGTKGQDAKVAQVAILAMAQKNGAEALRALAQLPEKLRGGVAVEMRGGLNDSVGKASGSLADITAVLRENPQLINLKSDSEVAVRRLVGQVASQAATADPVKAMQDLRQMAASLVEVKPGEDPKAAESAFVARIASQMTRTLRSDSPAAARVVFNSLADNEKNATMVALEASARFRESGTETAIQFAEQQSSPQYIKEAARGVWWSLAQQDRGAALQWIESLPQGSFRDGALNSVMQEASFRTRSWGGTEEALKAGTELKSTRSKVDYFTALAQQKRGEGLSYSEFIATLPLPDAEKLEMRRRLAPIPPK